MQLTTFQCFRISGDTLLCAFSPSSAWETLVWSGNHVRVQNLDWVPTEKPRGERAQAPSTLGWKVERQAPEADITWHELALPASLAANEQCFRHVNDSDTCVWGSSVKVKASKTVTWWFKNERDEIFFNFDIFSSWIWTMNYRRKNIGLFTYGT